MSQDSMLDQFDNAQDKFRQETGIKAHCIVVGKRDWDLLCEEIPQLKNRVHDEMVLVMGMRVQVEDHWDGGPKCIPDVAQAMSIFNLHYNFCRLWLQWRDHEA
jgi:hypothetical protein